jgi:serine/threonine protein kinase
MIFVPPHEQSEEQGRTEVENRRVFLDLLTMLLQVDPQERTSAEQALAHPFFSLSL